MGAITEKKGSLRGNPKGTTETVTFDVGLEK